MRKQIKSYLFMSFIGMLFFLLGAVSITDPTKPPARFLSNDKVAIPASSQSLKVTAIFVYANYRSAIINGQTVMVGDHLGEFTITAITPFTVELIGPQNGKEVLELAPTVKTGSTKGI